MLKKFKMVINKRFVLPFTVILSILFLGWGSVGHSIISLNTKLTLLPAVSFFNGWPEFLSLHASDADNSRNYDASEKPKHYIDIDSYPEFLQTKTIPQNYDSLVAKYGYSFVIDQGLLPWAILNTADSLEAAFKRNDINKSKLFAADLGHYIADAHMPLHLTKNYNGQLTGQYGVHFRYESDLIQKFENQINYGGDSLKYIDNLPNFVFSMIYNNYNYVDSVLYVDKTSTISAGINSSDVYYAKFWELSKNFTIGLFKSASNKIANVIYTTWVNSGGQVSGISENKNVVVNNFELSQNYPNPFNPSTKITWQSPVSGWQTIKLFNALGKEIDKIVDGYFDAGTHSTLYIANSALPSGVYFYQLTAGDFISTKKMILLK